MSERLADHFVFSAKWLTSNSTPAGRRRIARLIRAARYLYTRMERNSVKE